MLHTPASAVFAYAPKVRWEDDVGRLEDDEWSDALDTCKFASPKLSDLLNQLYILHRAYLTPLRPMSHVPVGSRNFLPSHMELPRATGILDASRQIPTRHYGLPPVAAPQAMFIGNLPRY